MLYQERNRKRRSRIKRAVPLDEVLETYGYTVRSGFDSEQQFSCDLHGDGNDSKPSARYYPESLSWHCFACGRSRDVIATVMEKEGLSFTASLTTLERRFSLPDLPWEVEETIPHKVDIQPHFRRVDRLLKNLTDEKDLSMEVTVSLWEAYDFVSFNYDKNKQEDKTVQALDRLYCKIMEKMGE